MNNNNLKRRRPYSHEGAPAEPALQDPPQSLPPSGIDSSSLSSGQRYILGEAALILNVPSSTLLGLSRQSNPRAVLEHAAAILNVPVSSLVGLSNHYNRPNKRPRVNSDIAMPSPFPTSPAAREAHEKSYPSGSANNDGPRPYPVGAGSDSGSLLGWSSAKLADCFASLCQPSSGYESDSGYQAVPETVPYPYDDGRPYHVEAASPIQDHDQNSYVATTGHGEPTNNGLFTCGDSATVAQFLQNYPPLQPSRHTGDQPTTRGEGMVYPGAMPNPGYYAKAEDPNSSLEGPRHRPEPLMACPSPFVGDMIPVSTSPTFTRQPTIPGMHRGYELVNTYGSSEAYIQGDRTLQSGHSNLDVVFPNQKAPASKRGPFKDHAERQKTAQTRKIGSCIRCRMQRIRCNANPEDERGVCLGCKKVTSKIWRLPCLRLKINDVILSKPGQVEGYEWTLRWKENMVLDDIGSWASGDVKTIFVTEGYTSSHVALRVREFVPQEGDRVERSWVHNGVQKSVRIPPYALIDLDATKSSYDNYIKNGLVETMKKVLGPTEKLLWQTYSLAFGLAEDPGVPEQERKLLSNTLHLWMAIRLTTKSFEIVGDERLGMSEDILSESSTEGKIPLPPVMGAQIDSILIHQIQARLRHDTLDDLQKLVTENKQKTWLTTYLSTFILLHNIALVMKHDAGYARKHGIKRRFAREDKVKSYHLGAVTLLAYFHYCNKGIFPFSEECKDQELRNLAKLDDNCLQFVHRTRQYANDHKHQWQDLWDTREFENDYYFVSQLFEHNWQPRSMD